MDNIYQKKDGSLFIKMNHNYLKGIFRLQLVSPLSHIVDDKWFEFLLSTGEINELCPLYNEERRNDISKLASYDNDANTTDDWSDTHDDDCFERYGQEGWESPSGDAFFPDEWDPS